MKKGDAQAMVAGAIGASRATIRHWDERDLPRRYEKDFIFWKETAREAGKLDAKIEGDSNYGRDGIDAHAFAFRERLKGEPLSVFAEKFKIFEGRYWSAGAGK